METTLKQSLWNFGWSPYFNQTYLSVCGEYSEFTALVPARITSEQRGQYTVSDSEHTYRAVLSGRLRHESSGAFPCVGDFVLLRASGNNELARIEYVFEPKSLFRRKVADARSMDQPIAANVDLAVIVCALPGADADPHALRHGVSSRRIERYLQAIRRAPAEALVIMNKADLDPSANERARELERELCGVPVIPISAQLGLGMAELEARIAIGGTAVLVGSSGVGKSSIINRLLGGDVQRTESVRVADTRGRHTTTHRELFVLPSGGILIDTPGMREFGLFADQKTEIAETGFDEIDALAKACRYRDCEHASEPGCAVREAVARGELSNARLEHAQRLKRELEWQKARSDQREQANRKKSMRTLSRAVREGQKRKARGD